MTINDTAQKVHLNAKAHGFFDEPKNLGEMLCLIHSEVSEALEADRKDHYATHMVNIDDSFIEHMNTADILFYRQEFETCVKHTFEDELADIVIRVMDLAAFKGVDLEYHIKMKMLYNESNPHKHGKKY